MSRALRSFTTATVIVSVLGCATPAEDTATATATATATDLDLEDHLGLEWEAVWSEEFSGAAIDRDTWDFETGNGHERGIPGWGNGEQQYYTDDSDNAFIRDGTLVIRARQEPMSDDYGTYAYSSARLISEGNFARKYGRIDVRAKLPRGQGVWPAIWMLGENLPEVGWPNSGEIDIVELVGHEPSTVHGTVHGPGYSGGDGISGSFTADAAFSEDFNVFSIIWNEDLIIWLVNDEPFHSVDAPFVAENLGSDWVYNDEFYFILNVAVGGRWPGYPDDTTEFPQELVVDYIRVSERAE